MDQEKKQGFQIQNGILTLYENTAGLKNQKAIKTVQICEALGIV